MSARKFYSPYRNRETNPFHTQRKKYNRKRKELLLRQAQIEQSQVSQRKIHSDCDPGWRVLQTTQQSSPKILCHGRHSVARSLDILSRSTEAPTVGVSWGHRRVDYNKQCSNDT